MNKTCLILLAFLAGGVRAQQRITPDSLLRILPDSFPQEKVYLHLDKDKYMGGDTLWFKAYIMSGILPADNSTGLHVELFDPTGKRILQKYFPILGGRIAPGQMELRDSMPGGFYTLRAYTDWMSNFDPAFFYHVTFPLYPTGPGARMSRSTAKRTPGSQAASVGSTHTSSIETAGDMDIQFLPEGGTLVENVLTNVAFRATDRNGIPVHVRGRIVDELDSVAAEFKDMHDGMGAFAFTPWHGSTYTAIVETPGGQKRVPLPPAHSDGVVLNAKQTGNGVGFILRADTTSRFLGEPLEIVGTMYGQLVFRAKTRLSADLPESGGFIPASKFVTGVLTITAFSSAGLPLAERAVFIQPSNVQMQASLSTDTLSIEPRGLNAWTIHVADTTRGYFSVSVTDADALVPGKDGPNILTSLLLSGELRGTVYRPAWYFKNQGDSTQQALDLVMLTHGWRRYDWEALGQGRFPVISRTGRNYLEFKGQALTESGKKVVKNTLLTLFLRGSDSTKKLILLPLDSSGKFTLDELVFFDTATAYFQVNKKGYAGRNVQLRLDQAPNFPLDSLARQEAIQNVAQEDSAYVVNGNKEAELLAGLRRLSRAKELQEIIIRGHRKTPMEELDERYTSALFGGGNARSFDLVNDNKNANSYFDVLSWLQGRVAGLQISGSFPNVTARYRGGTPDFFVDEMNTTIDVVESIPVQDIAYIKFMEPPFVGSFGGGPFGAVAIYTRRGGDEIAGIDGLNRLTLPGYALARQFYTPVYNAKDTAAVPDYRTTLSWEPYLFTDGHTRTLTVRFYNNDECRRLRIVVEGMDENGKLLHLEQVVDPGRSAGTKNP